ncbi:carcinoembryonic antigen-related cell adhesion molecule 5-like [Octopus vulgaris]|uniref:Carcinoembryonic antigen-related cell adhesion molecule 5-like n=1 Tax=Octopus vulgaris TaxID=6645 RepID=A0AA36BN41_OCTVU|nr:carcinoembryonic antigen-related cell adhesion molecule 5-like [Octopus vulgaris]
MNFLMEISLLLTSFLLLLLFGVPVVKSHAATFSISSSAKIGDSAQFFCNATTTVPQYYAHFMHNDNITATAIVPGVPVQSSPNTSVNGSGNQYCYKYTISSLSCSDRGNYRCYVLNKNGNVLESNSETLDVLGPAGTPNLTAPSDNQILNDIVTVSCESKVGSPAQELHLCVDNTCAKPNPPVKQVDQCIFTQTASLTFQVTKTTKTATCKVGSSSLILMQTWEVDYDPQTKPMSSTITEDPSTRKPNPSATTKKTVAIAASNTETVNIMIKSVIGTLTILIIVIVFSIILYKYRATRAKIQNVPVVKSQAATFSISSSAKIGDSAQFFCNATTTVIQYYAHFMHNDNITATAIVPGVPVQSSPNTSVNGSGNQYCYKYTISSLSCSDRGNYRCYVLNKNGNVLESNSETLDVLGPAGTPNLTAPSDNQILNDNVTVSCESNVGSPAQELHLCVGNTCAKPNPPVKQVDQCIFTQTASLTFQVTKTTKTATCRVGSSSLEDKQTWEVDYDPQTKPMPSTITEDPSTRKPNPRATTKKTVAIAASNTDDPQTKPMPSTITEDPSTRKPNPRATTKKTVAIAASITETVNIMIKSVIGTLIILIIVIVFSIILYKYRATRAKIQSVPVVKSHAATFSISSSAKIGDSAQFFCNATTTVPQYYAHFMHNDNITATAIVPGVPVQSSPNTSVNGSGNQYCYKYTISSLSCSDRGNYRCYVLNKNGNVLESNSETLDVLGPAGTPNLTAPSDNQILNDIVTVSCESKVGSPAQELHLCVDNTCAKPNPPVKQVDQCIFTQTASLTFQVTKTTKTATCKVGSSSLILMQTWEVDYDPQTKPMPSTITEDPSTRKPNPSATTKKTVAIAASNTETVNIMIKSVIGTLTILIIVIVFSIILYKYRATRAKIQRPRKTPEKICLVALPFSTHCILFAFSR